MGPTAHHHLQQILLGFRRKINLFLKISPRSDPAKPSSPQNRLFNVGPNVSFNGKLLRMADGGEGNIGNPPAHSYFRVSAGLAEAALTDWKPTVRTARTSVARPVPTNPSQPTPVR